MRQIFVLHGVTQWPQQTEAIRVSLFSNWFIFKAFSHLFVFFLKAISMETLRVQHWTFHWHGSYNNGDDDDDDDGDGNVCVDGTN